jgi:hypothetical protein
MFELHFVFQYTQCATPLEAWTLLRSSVPTLRYLQSNEPCECNWRNTTIGNVSKLLEETAAIMFHVKIPALGCNFDLDLGPIGNEMVQLFLIDKQLQKLDRLANTAWDVMAIPGILYGRVYDGEYDHYQNANYIAFYEEKGLSLEGKQLIDDRYARGGKRVDISGNPGRAVWYDNYVETIGHLMWFSELFWSATKQKKQIPKWVEHFEERNGVILIQASKDPFTNENPQDDVAIQLRSEMFPQRDDGHVM